jgi:hypothetical protein
MIAFIPIIIIINNNDTNITLESIATESPPGFWIINTDVTISPNQTLVIDPLIRV